MVLLLIVVAVVAVTVYFQLLIVALVVVVTMYFQLLIVALVVVKSPCTSSC